MHAISQLLQTTVIPWTLTGDKQRLIVARADMATATLPEGVTLTQRKIEGKRVIRKDLRKHNNQRLHIADWPDDNLQELALPRLVCVVSGTADYLLSSSCLHCEEGHFILIPSRVPHHRNGPFIDAGRPPHAACTLLFAYAYSHGIYTWFSHSQRIRQGNTRPHNYLVPNPSAVQLFNMMAEEATGNDKDSAAICHSLLHAFFSVLVREIECGRFTHPGPDHHREQSSTRMAGFAGELQEYIEANFNKPLKVQDAAARMYLSTPQFCRRVRQETGNTFIELLTNYRLERAQALLNETDWTASAIASHVGFRSSTYFQDLFRRRIGCTPLEYRHKKG